MPRTIGEKLPARVTVSFSPLNLRTMESAMQNKEFKTVADLVNTAITYYFENRSRQKTEEELNELKKKLMNYDRDRRERGDVSKDEPKRPLNMPALKYRLKDIHERIEEAEKDLAIEEAALIRAKEREARGDE